MAVLAMLGALIAVPSTTVDALPPQASEQGQRHARTHGPDGTGLEHGRRRGPQKPGVAAAYYSVDNTAPWSPGQYDGSAFTTDQPDVTTEPTFHAFYVYPSDRASRFSTWAAMFQADAKQASDRLGNLYGRGLRFDYRTGGFLDITVVRSTKTYAELSDYNQFEVVRNELLTRGLLSSPNKKYVAWLDAGSSFCGQGEVYGDTRRTSDNYNQQTTFSLVYRPFDPADADGGFCRGRTLAHELGHNMGALQPEAPHAFDGAHCDDSAEDVMCYGTPTTPDTGSEAFDYNNDDYWDPAANPARGSTATLPWWTVNLSRFVCSTPGCGATPPPPTPPPPPPPPNQPPVASFTGSCTGLTCTFTDASSDPDGSIAAWSWTFGDGATAAVRNPSRTYAAAGTYPVTLKVTDAAGATATVTKNVTVAPGATLTLRGSLRNGKYHNVELTWSGISGRQIDYYKDGRKVDYTANDGLHLHRLSKTGPATYRYKVCARGTTTCSPEVAVTF